MKIAIVLGTRPEIIKMSPVIRECEKCGLDFCILHMGQHYSFEMDRVFFKNLKLPALRHNCDIIQEECLKGSEFSINCLL